ncbi:MAG: hypothetical protein J1F60_01760 [Oscillospiraceae bacterium]|nr:hypothetical protein [Oscillospiraceae bacterium]
MTQAQLLSMASVVNAASESIYEAMKYIYSVAYEDFYDINVKDIFKIALSNITDPGVLNNLGYKIYPERIGDLRNSEFAVVKKIIAYSFAVRLPFLKRYLPAKNIIFTDNEIRDLFQAICDSGAQNVDGIVPMDFRANMRTAKLRDVEEPVFDTEWFKTWVYTYGKEFSVINNKNMFFLGCADALFPLYWSAVTDRLLAMIKEL